MRNVRTLAPVALLALAASGFAAPKLTVDITAHGGSPVSGGYSQQTNGGTYVSSLLPLQHTVHANAAGAGTGIGDASVLVGFGEIHGQASSSSTYTGFLPYQVNSAGGNASFDATFEDTLTITSKTLPVGTPVVLKQTLHTHAVLHRAGFDSTSSFTSIAGGLGVAPNFGLHETIDFNSGVYDLTVLQDLSRFLVVKVGDVLPILGDLYVGSVSSSSPYRPTASGFVDASNTYGQTFVVMTPGAHYIAASGALYKAAPVPEPASIGALVVGVVALIRRRRRA